MNYSDYKFCRTDTQVTLKTFKPALSKMPHHNTLSITVASALYQVKYKKGYRNEKKVLISV